MADGGWAVTVACEDRDFTEWRGGAQHVLVWAVDVDVPEVRAMIASARQRWADVLLPRYDRQPHVTIGYGGPMPADGPAPMDEVYTAERVEEAHAAVEALRLQPFEVRIGGWGSFQMSPFVAARAPELEALAEALGEGRERPYVPHVTIGHYGVAVPLAEVAVLGECWESPEVVVPVDRVSLMRYDAADIAGSLTEVGCVPLRGVASRGG